MVTAHVQEKMKRVEIVVVAGMLVLMKFVQWRSSKAATVHPAIATIPLEIVCQLSE